MQYFVFLILWVATCLSPSAFAQSPELQQLHKEVDEVREAYRDWAMKIHRRHWNATERTASFSSFDSFDWAQKADRETVETIAIAGENFRYEQTKPKSDRSVLIYDGRIARGRHDFDSSDGPMQAVAEHGFTLLIPGLPHTLPAGLYYPPDLSWLFGDYRYDSRGEDQADSDAAPDINISRTDWNEHRCWKLEWVEPSNRTCEAWLSQDKDLLPVRLQGSHNGEVISFEMTEFHKSNGTSREVWLPKKILGSYRHGTHVEIVCAELTPQTLPTNPRLFSAEPWFKPKAAALPAAGPDLPFLVVPLASGLPADTPGSSQWIRKRLIVVGSILSLLLIVIGIAWLVLTRNRYGREIRSFARRHQRLLSVLGIIATALVAIGCCWVPGWMHHGIAMVVTGFFGVLSLVIFALLLGRRTFSIKSALWLSLCIALTLAGYSQGLGRIRARHAMATQIRLAGGTVEITPRETDQVPFYLPGRLIEFFGDGFDGSVRSVIVPEQLFTTENVHSLGLDETLGVWIAPATDAPYRVDTGAIDAIERTNALEELVVSGGRLDGDAFRSLSRFDGLQRLLIDCYSEPLPDELALLRSLRQITLENPVVDDQFFEVLAKLPKLRSIKLHNASESTHISTEATLIGINTVQVHRTKLSANLLESLGRIECRLMLKLCNIVPPQRSTISMSKTSHITFFGTNVTDQIILSIGNSPNLKSIHAYGSKVTPAGLEAFAAERPDVLLSIRL